MFYKQHGHQGVTFWVRAGAPSHKEQFKAKLKAMSCSFYLHDGMHLKPPQARNVLCILFFPASDSLVSLPKFFGSYPIVHVYWGHPDMSTLLWPHRLQPSRLLCPWDFPSKNTGVVSHFLFQGIQLTQGLNPHILCLLHYRQILYHWATFWRCFLELVLYAVALEQNKISLLHTKIKSGLGIHRVLKKRVFLP